jgi:YaiO family outer membrane protein
MCQFQRILFFTILALVCRNIGFSQTDSVKFDYDKAVRVAQDLAISKQFDDARMMCNRILWDKPYYTDARLILSNVYSWQGYYEEAGRELSKIFEYDNANREAFLALIKLYIDQGKPEDGISVAKEALGFYPDDSEVILAYARACKLSGNFLEAKKGLLILLELDPENADAREMYYTMRNAIPVSNEGRIVPGITGPFDITKIDDVFQAAANFAANQQYDEARKQCLEILFYRPDYKPARVLLAQTYSWENNFSEARAELEKLKVELTGYRDGILGWIDVEKWSGNYSSAIRYCNLGLNFYPHDEDILIKKAEVYEAAGNYFEAKRTLFSYLSGHPDNIRFAQAYNRLMTLVAKMEAEARRLPVIMDTVLVPIPLDTIVSKAFKIAQDGDFAKAREMCLDVIRIEPDNYSANLLLGNILGWEQKYAEAVAMLEPLIKVAFDSKDVINSLIDVEMWAENFENAEAWVSYGLKIYPGDPDLTFKKAVLYQRSGELTKATETFGALLAANPGNKEYLRAYYSVKGPLHINGASAEYTHSQYNKPVVQNWNMFSLKYYKSTKAASLIGSVNFGFVGNDSAKFMNDAGLQFEFDVYPIFPKQKRYFHLNLGLSPSNIFARQRIGANIYNEIGAGWELSGGINYMRFRDALDTTHVFLFNVGISKYYKTFMGSFNLILAPINQKLSQGYQFTLRKYLLTPEDWIQISLGTGMFPDNPLYYLNDPNYNPTKMLSSLNAIFAARYRLSERWIGRIYAGYSREEYRQSFFRTSPILNLALIYLFKD